MKVVIDIKDSKADFFIELMKNFEFVRGIKEFNGKSTSALLESTAKAIPPADAGLKQRKNEWGRQTVAERKRKSESLKKIHFKWTSN